MAEFDQRARLKEVAEKLKHQKELEEQQDIEDHQNLLKSGIWKIFKGLMVFSLFMSALLFIDCQFNSKVEKIEFEKIQFYTGQMIFEGAYYTPHAEDLVGFEESSYQVVRSAIFRKAKYLTWMSEEYQSDWSAPKKYNPKYAMKRLSIYEYYPWPSIAFLIPLVVFIFKRPHPLFKFGRFICFLVVFPGALCILISLLIQI